MIEQVARGLIITASVAHRAAERGLAVEEVAKRRIEANALSPVPSGFSLRSLAEVATVLGVEPAACSRTEARRAGQEPARHYAVEEAP